MNYLFEVKLPIFPDNKDIFVRNVTEKVYFVAESFPKLKQYLEKEFPKVRYSDITLISKEVFHAK